MIVTWSYICLKRIISNYIDLQAKYIIDFSNVFIHIIPPKKTHMYLV